MPVHLKKGLKNGGNTCLDELEGERGLGCRPGDAGRRERRECEKERWWWIGGTDGFL